MSPANLCPNDRDFPVFRMAKNGFSIECDTCGTQTASYPSLVAAIAAWNAGEVKVNECVSADTTAES